MTDDRPSHRDFTRLDPTRPGHRAPDDDDADLTPVETIAAKLRAGVGAALAITPVTVPAGYDQILDALSGEMAQRLAELHARTLAAGDGVPRRLAAIERDLAELAAWRRRLTGEEDRNGRLGRLDATIAELRADVGSATDLDAARVTLRSARWIGAKLIAAIAGLCALIGVAASSVGSKYDAVVEDRGAAREWRRHVDADLDRLFATFNISRPRTDP